MNNYSFRKKDYFERYDIEVSTTNRELIIALENAIDNTIEEFEEND